MRVYQRGAPGVWVSSPPLPLPANANFPAMDSVVAASIGLDGDWLVVGAPNRTLQQEWGRGSVFFFGRDAAGTWALRQTEHGSGSAALFGRTVDLQGSEAIIAAHGQAGFGAVQVHRVVAGQWSLQQTILAPAAGNTQLQARHHLRHPRGPTTLRQRHRHQRRPPRHLAADGDIRQPPLAHRRARADARHR